VSKTRYQVSFILRMWPLILPGSRVVGGVHGAPERLRPGGPGRPYFACLAVSTWGYGLKTV
jgi:hypothetical protein